VALRVAELRQQLRDRGLSDAGLKGDLVARLHAELSGPPPGACFTCLGDQSHSPRAAASTAGACRTTRSTLLLAQPAVAATHARYQRSPTLALAHGTMVQLSIGASFHSTTAACVRPFALLSRLHRSPQRNVGHPCVRRSPWPPRAGEAGAGDRAPPEEPRGAPAAALRPAAGHAAGAGAPAACQPDDTSSDDQPQAAAGPATAQGLSSVQDGLRDEQEAGAAAAGPPAAGLPSQARPASQAGVLADPAASSAPAADGQGALQAEEASAAPGRGGARPSGVAARRAAPLSQRLAERSARLRAASWSSSSPAADPARASTSAASSPPAGQHQRAGVGAGQAAAAPSPGGALHAAGEVGPSRRSLSQPEGRRPARAAGVNGAEKERGPGDEPRASSASFEDAPGAGGSGAAGAHLFPGVAAAADAVARPAAPQPAGHDAGGALGAKLSATDRMLSAVLIAPVPSVGQADAHVAIFSVVCPSACVFGRASHRARRRGRPVPHRPGGARVNSAEYTPVEHAQRLRLRRRGRCAGGALGRGARRAAAAARDVAGHIVGRADARAQRVLHRVPDARGHAAGGLRRGHLPAGVGTRQGRTGFPDPTCRCRRLIPPWAACKHHVTRGLALPHTLRIRSCRAHWRPCHHGCDAGSADRAPGNPAGPGRRHQPGHHPARAADAPARGSDVNNSHPRNGADAALASAVCAQTRPRCCATARAPAGPPRLLTLLPRAQRMQLSPVLRARADAPGARFSDSACSSPTSVYLSAAESLRPESVSSGGRPAARVRTFCLPRISPPAHLPGYRSCSRAASPIADPWCALGICRERSYIDSAASFAAPQACTALPNAARCALQPSCMR
jgi:hypothetical protein